jgi:predicted hydrocarbon binding protein
MKDVMSCTKGVGFVNVRGFVKESFGAHAWDELLASLPHADREALGSVVSVGWYPLDLYARLIGAVDHRFGTGTLSVIHALGRYEAEKDLNTIHQFFLRMMNPNIVIEQMSKYWSRFHDTGEWQTERIGDYGAIATLSNWGVVDAGLCRELQAYLQRLLELCGCRNVTMDHPQCRTRGRPACEFRARWQTSKSPQSALPGA